MIENTIFAILTGDIVDSSRLRDAGIKPALELINNAGESARKQFPGAIHARVDVFRGDSWQMVVLEPAISIRISLYFRAFLRAQYGIDSRVSIGFGLVDYLPPENVSGGTGQAFSLSGQGLLDCQKPIRMKLNFPDQLSDISAQGLNIITKLVDLQAGRWTQSQSRAIYGSLIGLTQADIAANWQPGPISQQAVSQHLESAGWSQIRSALNYLEDTLPAVLVN